MRVFFTLRDGPETTQTWLPFSKEEADRFTRSIGYLIDHPWLLNDEKSINRRFWKKQQETRKKEASGPLALTGEIRGRESYHVYYAGSTIALKDSKGEIWWNDDPWSWYGSNESRYNDADQPFLSTVYPYMASHYPENKLHTKKDTSGWMTLKK